MTDNVEFTYGSHPTMVGDVEWHWFEKPWQSVVATRRDRFWDTYVEEVAW